MDKINMAIYPYNPEVDPILDYIHFLIPKYKIKSLISPKGWGYENKMIDLKTYDTTETIIVRSSLIEIADDVNCIFIPEFYSIDKIEFEIIDNINIILPRINKIICVANLKNKSLKKLQKICESTNGKCSLEIKNEIKMKTENDYDLKIYETDEYLNDNIPVPIIVIAGIWEDLDKFYTSLTIREMFLNNGYKVSQVGSRNYCEIMGFHSFPGFMLNPEIDEVKKVILFNRYIKKIYESENPDIIIITIPGAVQLYNSYNINKFGILHYLVCNAIIVDFLIMCTFFEDNKIELFEMISKSCFYKFGCSVDCFHMSNRMVHFDSTDESDFLKYLILPRKKVDETLINNYEQFIIPIINIFDKSNIIKLYDNIINKFSN